MRATIRFLLEHRIAVLSAIFLLTLLAAWSASRGIVSSSIGRMFLNEHPAYSKYLSTMEEFGNDVMVFAAWQDSDPLSLTSLKKLRQVERRLRKLDDVRKIRSLLDAVGMHPNESGDLEIRKVAREARKYPDKRQKLLEELLTDSTITGFMLSHDGKHQAVIIEYDVNGDKEAEKLGQMMTDVRQAFSESGLDTANLHLTGLPASIEAVIQSTIFNLRTLFPWVLVSLLLFSWLLFPHFSPLLLNATVSIISVIWAMGFSVALDVHISILTALVPPVILIISFSDVVHLCSAYFLEINSGKNREDAILASASEVGKACLFTSITTLFGFLSLALIPTPVFRHLGVVLGFGVAMSLLLATALVPILFSFLPTPSVKKRKGISHKLVGNFLDFSRNFATTRPRTVVFVFAIIAIVAAWGSTRMRVEAEFSQRLSENHRFRKDLDYFNRNFAGAGSIEIFAHTKNGILDPNFLTQVQILQDSLAEIPGINRTTSLTNLLSKMHQAMEGKAGLPSSREEAAQYLLLFEMQNGGDLSPLMDFDKKTLHIRLQLEREKMRQTYELGLRSQKIAESILGPAVEVEVTGMTFLLGEWLENIVAGQKNGLFVAFFSIALMMIFALKNFRIGLLSMLPNLFPLLVLTGWLGFFHDSVDSDNMALLIMAIGIGVDDTIHFLMRLKTEWSKDSEQALKRTFFYSGRGIAITSGILFAGFLPFAASDYASVHSMGTLLPLTFVAALIADVLLVPAMVQLGWIHFKTKA